MTKRYSDAIIISHIVQDAGKVRVISHVEETYTVEYVDAHTDLANIGYHLSLVSYLWDAVFV